MTLQDYKPGEELSSIDFQGMIGGPLSAIVDAQAQAALASVNFIKSVGFTEDTQAEDGRVTPGSPIYVTFKYPKVLAPYQAGILGNLVKITVKAADGGQDYIDGETVSVEGTGTDATAVITVQSGKVTSLLVKSGGSGYTKDEPVTIISSAGSGFLGKATEVDDVEGTPAVVQEMELEVPILTMLPIPFIRVEEAEIDFHAKITSMSYANIASNIKASTAKSEYKRKSGTKKVGAGINLGFFKFGAGGKSRYTNSSILKTNLSYQSTSRAGNKIDKVFQLGVKVKVTQAEMPEGMDRLMGILEDSIIATPSVIPQAIEE